MSQSAPNPQPTGGNGARPSRHHVVLEPVPLPPRVTESRTKGEIIEGTYWPANTCDRCLKWFPPYMAGVPSEQAENYCWGHKIEDAVAPVLASLDAEADRMEAQCKHPPCSHAWGIRHAVEAVRMELDPHHLGRRPEDG